MDGWMDGWMDQSMEWTDERTFEGDSSNGMAVAQISSLHITIVCKRPGPPIPGSTPFQVRLRGEQTKQTITTLTKQPQSISNKLT